MKLQKCSLRITKATIKFYYIKFRTTHHQEKSRAIHNSMAWINDETGEPCGLNPCEVCIERKELGLEDLHL
jgi:hypothetical protein